MGSRRLTVQRVLQESFTEFDRSHPLPTHTLYAARRIRLCRTGALGAHIKRCPNGDFSETRPNSCRHRSCPTCRYLSSKRWLERAARRLLQCPHFHLVFTLPHELNPLWVRHSREMTQLLYNSVSATLFEFLEDDRHLGATPGFIASLHSWSRTLLYHPHVHVLTTAGGIAPDGTWREADGFLLPVRAAAVFFQGHFLDALNRSIQKREIVLPSELSEWPRIMNRLYKMKWNVFVKEKISDSRHVLDYLARYLRGGPIGNSRLVASAEDSVTFRHSRDANASPMTLSRDEFLSRLMRHVPIPGIQLVRNYGLYANNRLREYVLPLPTTKQNDSSDDWIDQSRCPNCGAELIVEFVHRSDNIPQPPDARSRGSPLALPAAA